MQKYKVMGLNELRKGVDASYLPSLIPAVAAVCKPLATQDFPAAQDYQRYV